MILLVFVVGCLLFLVRWLLFDSWCLFVVVRLLFDAFVCLLFVRLFVV